MLISSFPVRTGGGEGLADDFAAQTYLPHRRDRRKCAPRCRRARWARESEDHTPRMESLRASRLDQTRINECASGRGRSREIEDHGAPLTSWDAAWERARTPRGHASALAPPPPRPSALCPLPSPLDRGLPQHSDGGPRSRAPQHESTDAESACFVYGIAGARRAVAAVFSCRPSPPGVLHASCS